MPLSQRAFTQALAELGRDEFAGFVVDLWNGRGASTAVADGGVRIDGTRYRLVVPTSRSARLVTRLVTRTCSPDVDGVATPDPAVAATFRTRGVPVIGPRELYETSLYGLDRESAAAITDRWLEHSLSGMASADARRFRSSPALVAVLVLFVLVPTALGFLAGADGLDDRRVGDMTPARFASGPAAGAPPTAAAADSTVRPERSRMSSAPSARIAAAHRRAVSDRSYRLIVRYTESATYTHVSTAASVTTAVREERIYVRNKTVVAADCTGQGTVRADDPATGFDRTNACTRRAAGPGARSTPVPSQGGAKNPQDETQPDVVDYIEQYLHGANWTVTTAQSTTDARTYHLTIRGTERAGVVDYSGSAVVTREGFVRSFRVEYIDPNPGVVVRFVFRYEPLEGAQST